MAVIDSPENFEIGRVVSRTFAVIQRNAVTFLALSALLMLPLLAFTIYDLQNSAVLAVSAARSAGKPVALAQSLQSFYATGWTILLGALSGYVLQAALVQGTVIDLNGERPSLGNCLGTGFKQFLPILAITILAYLGMFAGIILLVVPGIILALAWSVVIPVRVVEQEGIFESFGRSRALTKGHRWKILGLVAMYILIAFLVQMVLGLAFGVATFNPNLGKVGPIFPFASWLLRVPLATLAAVGIASTYYELRMVKEGVGAQQLAAAFD